MDDHRWWHNAVGYEVYLRSFADGNGDGIGDLVGLLERVDYLARLGVNLVWLTPFYPSPLVDYGYDVADYRDVDPTYGDLADLDAFLEVAHGRGMRVVVDLVPNHTSDQHEWFVDANSSRDSLYRNYYVWADPGPDGGPPNNWISYFGGPAWTLDERSRQYYLHLFLPGQPDLNWSNPAVLDEFDDILRFWLDRGVDGFRIDVAQALAKDPALRSNPQIGVWRPDQPRWQQWNAFDHRYDILQPAALDVFRRWQTVVDPYDGLLLGETYILDPDELASLIPGDGLHLGFWFQTMHIDWDPEQVRRAIADPLAAVDDPAAIGWVVASHDEQRPPTRFGGGDVGRRRALAFSTLLFGLPGLPVLYQGEELGLVDGEVPDDQRADPVGADVTLSRDGCRTPMPWGPGRHHGFSTAETTWLPMGGRSPEDGADWQLEHDGSWFHRYAELVSFRRSTPALAGGTVRWLDDQHHDLVAYRNGNLIVAANLGLESRTLQQVTGDVRYATAEASGEATAGAAATGATTSDVALGPDDAVIIAVPPG